jgi:peptide/nickel transport system ATP-binding protein
MADQPLLQAENVRVVFDGGGRRVAAVNGVNVSLAAGRTLGVVGESGSGKSVLARTLMGLIVKRDGIEVDGTIRFEGTDTAQLSREQRRHLWGARMAMIFQDPMTSLTPVVKIGRQIEEPLRFHLGLSKSDARGRAAELLEQVGIPEARRRLKEYPYALSGGMRQRVLIAIALSCSPRLLIADEPTTALDVTVQQQILNLLQSLQQASGMAMILISHDLGVVASRTEEVAVMYGGRIVEQASTRDLFRHPRHPYTNALLASVPRRSYPSHTRLQTIGGSPIVPIEGRIGCSFAPRCPRASEVCRTQNPVPVELSPGHFVECFHPVEHPETYAPAVVVQDLVERSDAAHTDVAALDADVAVT